MTAKIARVLDFESDGLPDEDEQASICEVAFVDIDLTSPTFAILPESRFESLIKTDRPMPVMAKSVHHITDEMLDDAPPRTHAYQALASGLSDDDVYVAHNAAFDSKLYSGRPQKWVCTYKCALRAWPDAERHNNQYLRYFLELDLDPVEAMPPHRAAADVWVTAHIMQRLLALRPIERLIEISSDPGFLPKFTFGKHYGKTFKEVVDVDHGYLEWIVDKSDLDEDVKFTSRWWLQKHAAAQLPVPA